VPFTRLVHVMALPLPYLFRPYQVVIWNHQRNLQYDAPAGDQRIGPDVPYLRRG
jgi:hypothetical protein